MCIAIYKEIGQPIQKKKMYKRCFDKNPDGAGYAWYKDEKDVWVVTKGLMNFKSFWRSFNRASRKYDFTNRQVLVHFRVGTSGNRKGPDCTHPFPVTPHLDLMRHLKFETRNLVAHNGVIGPGFGTASDTMIGVRDYIDLLWELKNDDRAMALWKEHLKFEKCRWWMAEGAEVRMFGDWINSKTYQSHFSNVGYRPDPPKQEQLPTETVTATPFLDTSRAPLTHRYYRNGDYSEFCNVDNEWSWGLWMGANQTHYSSENVRKTDEADLTSPNEMMDYVECPASVMALLDKDGNILWDDDYSPAEDLPQCPSCLSEELTDSGMLYGDTGCTQCGCIFRADTGDIVLYDPEICKELKITMQCLTCHEQTTLNSWGECEQCGTILDATLAERRIKEQQNGR
jgi:hypothetical protein